MKVASQKHMMEGTIKLRLAVMMFLQYMVMGAVWPILSLYLKQYLGFTGTQTGIVLAMSSVAAFVSPVVGACVADRLVSAERLLSLCHFAAALLMAAISQQTQFPMLVILYLAYALAMGPTVPLTNAITFHHHPDGHRNFGHTRVWGTISWVLVAWGFGFLWLGKTGGSAIANRLPDALQLSALASLALSLYGLTLPKAGKRIEGPVRLVPVESLRIFIKPEVLFIALVSLLIGIVDRYYYFGAAIFLRHRGFSEAAIMPTMSAGQITEIIGMFTLAWVMIRIGIKRTLLLGILAEIGRFSAFSWGHSKVVLIAGNACHGLAYSFYFTAIYITLDSFSTRQSRTGLHQLFAIVTSGVGSLSANLLGGWCMDTFVSGDQNTNFTLFWLVPATLSVFCFVLITAFFKAGPVAGAGTNEPD